MLRKYAVSQILSGARYRPVRFIMNVKEFLKSRRPKIRSGYTTTVAVVIYFHLVATWL